MSVRWSFATPTGAAGAIAAITLVADDAGELDAALEQLVGVAAPPGNVRVRQVAGIDRGVVARWTPTSAELMPHAGRAVAKAMREALTDRLGSSSELSPRERYPEADTEFEARMLDTLARAASPRALDLLLDQPRRWASGHDAVGADRARALARLLDPPLVVAVGPPNVGKSSLLNALGGRELALAADEPGTTRDHVGALLELDGLVVRFVDTPGRGPGAPPSDADAQAAGLAREMLARADLVLSCFDATSPPVAGETPAPVLRVATRADRFPSPSPADAATSARTGRGIADLARLVRRILVPDEALADPRPWAFWGPEGHPA